VLCPIMNASFEEVVGGAPYTLITVGVCACWSICVADMYISIEVRRPSQLGDLSDILMCS